MPFTSRYLMEQQARGRPHPRDTPEERLFTAIARLDAMGTEQAMHWGASARCVDPQGRSPLHALFDTAERSTNVPGPRTLACAQALLRQGADPMARHPISRLSALIRAGGWVGRCGAPARWLALWEGRGDWRRPDANGQRPWEAWAAHAEPALAERIKTRLGAARGLSP